MKINFFISSLSGGGAEKVLVNLANSFASMGNDVVIVSLEKREQFYVPKENVKVIKIKNPEKYNMIKDFLEVKRIIKKRKADINISFLSRCNILVLLAALFSKQKVVVSDRNNPLKEHSQFVFLLQNFIYMRANQVIVQTQQIKDYYWKNIQKKITIIENPIDTQSLDKQVTEIPDREKVIVSMGRLESQKDFKTLIRAFSKIESQYSEWKLKIFGKGHMLAELKQEAKNCGVEKQVLFCGRTETPYLEMRKASIFVLSSFYEGFPNVLCEAMYAGDLCISSDCVSGPRELIESEKNGWLFEIGNVNQLAEILKMCIEKEKQLDDIRLNAQNTVRRLYLEKNIKKWTLMIKTVIEQGERE